VNVQWYDNRIVNWFIFDSQRVRWFKQNCDFPLFQYSSFKFSWTQYSASNIWI